MDMREKRPTIHESSIRMKNTLLCLYIRCDRESKEIDNENDMMQKYV